VTTPLLNPELVYKIVSEAAYLAETRDGVFTGMPIDKADGYCHLSTAAQLAETLSLHFRGQSALLILAVRTFDLGTKLRWEPSRGGQLFPHYYGELPLSAVAWTAPVSVGPQGEVDLPEAVV
jgi:uncharacterized protein (DUF952 family)